MVEGKQVWNQVKIETAGDILLSKGWSVCFVFKEQVTDYSFSSCHGTSDNLQWTRWCKSASRLYRRLDKISIIVQQDATIYSFIIFSVDSSTCFGWYRHPSSGAHSNCNYNIWYWSNRICYCPLIWRSQNCSSTSSMWSAQRIPTAVNLCFLDRNRYFLFK